MPYPQTPDYRRLIDQITLYAQLKHEHGAEGIAPILAQTESALQKAIDKLRALQGDAEMALREPDDLPTIQALRPDGPRKLWATFDEPAYRERLSGALLGRMAGNCRCPKTGAR